MHVHGKGKHGEIASTAHMPSYYELQVASGEWQVEGTVVGNALSFQLTLITEGRRSNV